MANREACELYIEQQIEEALEEGKTPYSIGKELSSMIERIFETKMPPKTLEKRAGRIKSKLPTNVGNDSTALNNCNKSKSNENQTKAKRQPAKDGTMRGGHRKNAGRKPKPPSDARDDIDMSMINGAIHFATVAISFLERITIDDPYRTKAIDMVVEWINKEI